MTDEVKVLSDDNPCHCAAGGGPVRVVILCLPLIVGSYFRYGLAKALVPSFEYYQPLQWKEED